MSIGAAGLLVILAVCATARALAGIIARASLDSLIHIRVECCLAIGWAQLGLTPSRYAAAEIVGGVQARPAMEEMLSR